MDLWVLKTHIDLPVLALVVRLQLLLDALLLHELVPIQLGLVEAPLNIIINSLLVEISS